MEHRWLRGILAFALLIAAGTALSAPSVYDRKEKIQSMQLEASPEAIER
jgi:hypothetical protein